MPVTGAAEIMAGLARFEHRVAAEGPAQEALMEALEPIKDAMQQNLEPHRRSGKTIEDVQVRPLDSHEPGVVRAEVGLSAGKRGRSYIGNFLEFGTVKQAAAPWARPALDVEQPGFLSRLAEAWKKKVMRG